MAGFSSQNHVQVFAMITFYTENVHVNKCFVMIQLIILNIIYHIFTL